MYSSDSLCVYNVTTVLRQNEVYSISECFDNFNRNANNHLLSIPTTFKRSHHHGVSLSGKT